MNLDFGRLTLPSLSLSSGVFRSALAMHPEAQRVRWLRAAKAPGMDKHRSLAAPPPAVAAAAGGRSTGLVWVREEQDTGGALALVRSERTVKRLFPQMLEIRTGDVSITVMPDEMPLGERDVIVPMGRADDADGLPLAARVTEKEVLTRGAGPAPSPAPAGTPGVGSIVIPAGGVSVSGVGTAFLSFFAPGDVLVTLGQALRVASVQSDTFLTLHDAVAERMTVSQARYERADERLRFWPGLRLVQVRDAERRVYVPGVDVDLVSSVTDEDEALVPPLIAGAGALGRAERLRWTSAANSPAPGVGVSVIYERLPCYIVRSDLGISRRQEANGALPLSVVGRLWTPEEDVLP